MLVSKKLARLTPRPLCAVSLQAKSFFEGLGWWQTGHDSSSSIAKDVCGAEAKFSFPLRKGKMAGTPADGDYLFFVAENRPAK